MQKSLRLGLNKNGLVNEVCKICAIRVLNVLCTTISEFLALEEGQTYCLRAVIGQHLKSNTENFGKELLVV